MSFDKKSCNVECCENLITLLSKKALIDDSELESSESIVQWFDILRQSLKNDDPLAVKAGNNRLMLVPYLFDLLRECFLTHRWHDSLKILNELADVSSGTANTVWKAGLQVFYCKPEANDHMISQLVGQMKLLTELNAKEVVLEFVMFLLHRGQIDDTKQMFQSVPKHKGTDKASTARSRVIDTLFQAYQGLVWYVEWLRSKQIKDQMEKMMEETEYFPSQWSDTNHEQVLVSHATKAVAFFSSVVKETGVWDIFITKYVELLEFFGKLDEAQLTLEQYRDRNKENPNAHKFLYYFVKKHGMVTEEQIKHLQAIAECVPSDSLVLKLVEILWRDKHSSAILYLFSMLDYSCWQTDSRPWELLSSVLREVYAGCDDKEHSCVKTCWRARSSWWPNYQFKEHTSSVNTNNLHLSINFNKAVCAIFLLGRDNPFTIAISKSLDTHRREELSECMKVCPAEGIT